MNWRNLQRLVMNSAWVVAAVWGLSFSACLQAADVSVDTAREHLQKGRYDEAVEACEQLEKSDPIAAALIRSRAQEAVGDLSQAVAGLTTTAAKHGKDAAGAPLFARLAEVQLLQGQYDEADKNVAQALKLNPDLPAARLVQADLYTATGKLKQADEQYRWFVRYYNKAQPEDAETLMLVARGSAQYARWNRVSRTFDFIVNTLCPDALKNDKNHWQANYLAGNLLLEKYNRADAMPEFKAALTINPRAADVHAAMAMSSMQDHQLEEAGEQADSALKINPRSVVALHVKADLKLDEGDATAAFKILQDALHVNPHDERTLARVGTCYLMLDGLPSDENLEEVFKHLDDISQAKVKQPSRFTTLLIELAKRNPHPGLFLSQLGEVVEGRRRFELAERFYSQAISTMPQLAEPRTNLGMLYMRIGRNADARKILDEAFKADPYHIRVSNMIKVLKVLDTYETVETEHFIIRVDSKLDRILGRYMAEYLEAEYGGLVKQFGYEPPGKTQFEIFNKYKGLSGHQWFSARMVGLPWIQTIGASTGKIVALASPTEAKSPYNWARVLKHEYVHILTLQQTKFNIPHWYTEALATLNEGYPRSEMWNQLLKERVPKGELMNLDTVNQGFIRPKTPNDWQMAYCQSLLYAQYMSETFGKETISKMLDCYRDNLTTEDAITRTTGVSKAAFEKGYLEYLQKIVADLTGGDSEPEMSLADLEKAHQKNPDDLTAAARFADGMLKANKRKDARELALKVVEKDKKQPLAAIVLAKLEMRGEDLPAAIAYLEPALDRAKPNPQVLELLAQLQLKNDNGKTAIELYELGLKHRPNNVELLKGLTTAALNTGDGTKLRSTLKLLADCEADDASVRKKLAELALEDKAYAEAVEYGRAALYVDVMDVETHKFLAQAYEGLEQPAKALQELQVAAEIKPDDNDLAVEVAKAEIAAGKKAEAKTRLEALLKKSPNHAVANRLMKEIGAASDK